MFDRARRRKCVSQDGHEKCDYCELHGTECVHELPRGGWYEQRAIQQSQAGTVSNETYQSPSGSGVSPISHHALEQPVLLPETNLLLELVGLYFDYIHDQFHSLFHRPSFFEDIAQQTVPEGLLYGMVGLGSRFSTNPVLANIEPRDRGRKYLEEAEKRLNLRDISLETVQLAVLLGAGSTGDGDTESENNFYSVACRTAQLVGLPSRPVSSALQREIDTRG